MKLFRFILLPFSLSLLACGGKTDLGLATDEPDRPDAPPPELITDASDAGSNLPPDAGARLAGPPEGRWRPLGSALYCEGHTATLVSGGRVLVVGSCQLVGEAVSALLYDVAADGFTVLPFPNRRDHTATPLDDGRVLLAGGRIDGTLEASATLFDPATNTFTAAGSLQFPRRGHTATELADGRVLVAGGWLEELTTASVEIWSPGQGFSLSANLPQPRFQATATRIGTHVFVVGGGAPTVARFDPIGDSWQDLIGWFGIESVGTVAAIDQKLLCVTPYEGARLFDPADDSVAWVADGSLPHRASAPIEESWLFVGGSYYAIAPYPAFFTPDIGSFTHAGLWSNAYYDVTATAISSTSVLVVGTASMIFSSSSED
jgi:hypothetical protein